MNIEKNKYGAYVYDLRLEGFDEVYQEPSLLIWINEDSRCDRYQSLFEDNPQDICYEDCQDFDRLSDDQKADLWKMILSYKEELKKAVDNYSCTALEQRKSRLYY